MRAREYEFRGTTGSFGLPEALEQLKRLGADWELVESRMGRRREDPADAVVRVQAATEVELDVPGRAIERAGGRLVRVADARLARVLRDGALPAGFHSTTNHPTEVRVAGKWVKVSRQKMDAAIVVSASLKHAECHTMGDVRRGERVVVGEEGVRVRPPEDAGAPSVSFGFMASGVSSEKPIASLIARIADEIRTAKAAGLKVCVVAGPALVHTGASATLASLIRSGTVDVLFAGNALAAHDIERQIFGTSLGSGLDGVPRPGGHRNHLYAINEVRAAGSIKAMVKSGRLKGGVMFEAVRAGIPFVLAGSIRDDGPLPEVMTDVIEAQKAMRSALEGVGVVLMLATMLHAVAVGNLLGSHVRTVCVDINPATVTKLSDRGTAQAVGIVTDVGVFLPQLAAALPAGAPRAKRNARSR
ncbi:MAG: TIGR00300 family protein [Planctomycetes bacterium]|nr:TIGR00300 family protein [Planctomycetota bacterium]